MSKMELVVAGIGDAQSAGKEVSNVNLQLLRDAVAAKVRYWDAVGILEKALLNGNDPTDKQSDTITHEIENLAAGLDDPEDVFECIDIGTLESLAADLAVDAPRG